MAKTKTRLTAEEIELSRKAKNLYAKQWRKNNPEAWADIQARYIIRKAIREGLMDADGNELSVK